MKILFIQTGGTIDKDYPKTTSGYAFEISEPAVKRILQKINPSFDFEVIRLLQKDSLDITKEDRDKISEACLSSDSVKIIITHGTDTMIETAEYLSGIKGKTIVLTGAVKPEKFKDSDAEFNIGFALGALSIAEPGVYIAMNGRLFKHDKVKRDKVSGKFIENL